MTRAKSKSIEDASNCFCGHTASEHRNSSKGIHECEVNDCDCVCFDYDPGEEEENEEDA